MKDVMNNTYQDFLDMEYKKPEKQFNGFVIVPMGYNHDSGFGCMKFILVKGFEIVGVIGGGADVVHLNGIGGYGEYGTRFDEALATHMSPRVGWSMDFLPESNCVRVLCDHWLSLDPLCCSDFIVYVGDEIYKRERKEQTDADS